MKGIFMERELPAYQIIRSRRKTVALRIERDLTVTVRCPCRMPTGEIEKFVSKHREWLERHLQAMREQQERRVEFSWADGQVLYLLGKAHTLATRELEDGAKARLGEGHILVCPDTQDRREAVLGLFRKAAREHLADRVAHYIPRMGVVPASLKITGAQTRWGSCSSKGGICFSWRLICLPANLVDYVVVHELAHLREHNHSKQFYQLVAEVLPDYAARQRDIREWQRRLPI